MNEPMIIKLQRIQNFAYYVILGVIKINDLMIDGFN